MSRTDTGTGATVPGRDAAALHATERAQAVVRFYIGFAAAAYIIAAAGTGLLAHDAAVILLAYMVAFFLVSAGLLVAIDRDPGVRHWRRAAAMANDYGSIALVLSVGGQAMLPVSATLVWITVGYGMRYGPRYLSAGTIGAVLAIVAATAWSPFWRGNPYVVATVALTVLMVPFYANLLLTRTRSAHEQAVAANRAKSQILAQASHDLRQPVHAIGLFTNCLRTAPLGPDEQLMVSRIERSLQSISRLFRSLLDLSTLDSGRVTARRDIVALDELLAEVVAQNSEAAHWAGVDLRIVPTRLRVVADRALLATIVQNLVSNALKYAAPGPVLVGCRRRRGRVAIEVHDRGPGIPAEHLRQIFDEFYRVPRAGHDVEGVGLGLSIVRRMAALMTLDVKVRSTVGRGTAMCVDGLRIAPPQAVDAPRRGRHPTPLDGLRILLIEDDREVREATSALLANWGCDVRAVPAAPPAGCACDLIIADFDLGDGDDGCAAIEKLRAAGGGRIPAILITGHDALPLQAMLGDDTPVLSKPVRPAELRAAVAAQSLTRPAAPRPADRAGPQGGR